MKHIWAEGSVNDVQDKVLEKVTNTRSLESIWGRSEGILLTIGERREFLKKHENKKELTEKNIKIKDLGDYSAVIRSYKTSSRNNYFSVNV